MRQTKTFLATEADAWFIRNRAKLGTEQCIKEDLLLNLIEASGIKPKHVLEVGCANGWRLNELYHRYSCTCTGVEPSIEAQKDALDRYPAVSVKHGMAHQLNFTDASFDLVIYGFCLYLVEPRWLFWVAAEGDRVLKDGGHLAIMDFMSRTPHSVAYHHYPNLRSYKMSFDKLWLWHPAYQYMALVDHPEDKQIQAVIMHKNMDKAFPLKEQA